MSIPTYIRRKLKEGSLVVVDRKVLRRVAEEPESHARTLALKSCSRRGLPAEAVSFDRIYVIDRWLSSF